LDNVSRIAIFAPFEGHSHHPQSGLVKISDLAFYESYRPCRARIWVWGKGDSVGRKTLNSYLTIPGASMICSERHMKSPLIRRGSEEVISPSRTHLLEQQSEKFRPDGAYRGGDASHTRYRCRRVAWRSHGLAIRSVWEPQRRGQPGVGEWAQPEHHTWRRGK
jgi:hypothetical protein